MKAISSSKVGSKAGQLSVWQISIKAALGVWVSLVLVSCAGSKVKQDLTAPTQPPIQEMKGPEWLTKGSGAFNSEQGKVFYGVGVSDYKDVVLQRTAADNQARKEVAKVLESYTASLEKEYRAVTTGGAENLESSESHTENAMKTITSMTLSGVEIIDHWQNPVSRELYALARFDLAAFKKLSDQLGEMNEMDEKLKAYIKENADRLHEELQKEEEKRQGN